MEEARTKIDLWLQPQPQTRARAPVLRGFRVPGPHGGLRNAVIACRDEIGIGCKRLSFHSDAKLRSTTRELIHRVVLQFRVRMKLKG